MEGLKHIFLKFKIQYIFIHELISKNENYSLKPFIKILPETFL